MRLERFEDSPDIEKVVMKANNGNGGRLFRPMPGTRVHVASQHQVMVGISPA